MNRLSFLALATVLTGACSSQMAVAPAPDMTFHCNGNSDCSSATTGHVCSKGNCVVCASSADCPMGKKCDGEMACVDCLGPGDCMAGQVCNNKQCTTGCDGKNPCPTGQVCDPLNSVCVQCAANHDCSGGTPICDSAQRMCVQCTADSDCGPGKVCNQKSCPA